MLVLRSSAFESLQASRLTLVQILINSQGLNMNPLQSLYYVSPACLLGLTIPFCALPTSSKQTPNVNLGKGGTTR